MEGAWQVVDFNERLSGRRDKCPLPPAVQALPPEPSCDSPPRPVPRAVCLPRRAPSRTQLRGSSQVLVTAALLVRGPPASGFRAVVLGV